MDNIKHALSILKFDDIKQYESSLLERDLNNSEYVKQYKVFGKTKTKIISLSPECAKQIVYRDKLRFMIYRIEEFMNSNSKNKFFASFILDMNKKLNKIYNAKKDNHKVDVILEHLVNTIERQAVEDVKPNNSIFTMGPNLIYSEIKSPSLEEAKTLTACSEFLNKILNNTQELER